MAQGRTSNLFAVAALLTCSGTVASTARADDALDVAQLRQVAQVDPRFQSYNVEMAEVVGGRFWAPYSEAGKPAAEANTQASGGLALDAGLFRQRPPADLGNRRLRVMARALGPAYIRVSGSWANTTYFQDDDRPPMAKPPAGFQNVLTRRQWKGVIDFARAVDGRITTSFAVSAGTRDATGQWTPDEARKLLRFTRSIGGRIHSAELMNEPNLGFVSGLPANYQAKDFASDVAAFAAFVRKETRGLKMIGPGSTGETGVALFANRGLPTEALLGTEPRAKFDIFSYHFYGARSERCTKLAPASAIRPQDALSEAWLGRTDAALTYYKALRDRHMPGAPIWLNETAQASCGGDRWAGTFLDTFRYVDQLGRLAKQNVAAVFHNTLAASDYGLIDEATLTPRPSFWAAVLWRRLMGPVVLDAGVDRDGLHVYAHCLAGRKGGVALAVLNLDTERAEKLAIPAGGLRFTLTAPEIQSRAVSLNGRGLALQRTDRMPVLQGLPATGSLSIPPASITFVAFSQARNAACR